MVSTIGAASPLAAVAGIAVTDALEIIFDTLTTSRKYANLRADPRVALVIGWDAEQTVQYEGIADLPAGADLDACKQTYFATWPDGSRTRAMARHRLYPHPPALGAIQRFRRNAAADRGDEDSVSGWLRLLAQTPHLGPDIRLQRARS